MLQNQSSQPTSVIGPLGEPLTMEMLPPPETRRWVIRRKAEVVAAVNGGLLTLDQACDRYGIEMEELCSWQRTVERSGMRGLRVTLLQYYRDPYERVRRHRHAANLATIGNGCTAP